VDERSDEQLLAAYLGGEAPAMRELIVRYHDDLIRFLTRLTNSRDTADDVFQETFIQIHRSGSSFDPERTFRPWLFTIAANKARDHLRKQSRRRTLDLSAPVGGGDSETTFVDLLEVDVPPPDSGVQSEERSRLVQEALSRMTAPLREILVLAYFQRLSYSQISDDLGIPLGTVKSRLHAAVASFAQAWRSVNTPGSNTPNGSGGAE